MPVKEMPVQMPREDNDPGLARAFAIGEMLPWKGLVMEIEMVEYDRITLKAVGMTMRRAKERGLA